MGIFWDNPDDAAARRRADAERRQREQERENRIKTERAKAEKIRQEQRAAERKAQQEEDDKAIAEMQKKFQGDQSQKAKDAKAAMGLNRGPGLGSSGQAFRNPNVQLASGTPGPTGFNPNAPRSGHEDEVSGKGGAGKAGANAGPKLPRPF